MCRGPDSRDKQVSRAPTMKRSKSTNGFDDDAKPETVMNRPMQVLLLAALVLPVAIGVQVDPAGVATMQRWCAETAASAGEWATSATFLAACALLSVERLCYTWVWVFTRSFEQFCGLLERFKMKDKSATPVDVIVSFFWVNKLCQYGGFALLYLKSGAFPSSVAPVHALVGASLLGIGQLLNIGIYRAIGKNGVYYGCKFGLDVPWCTGFPFNVVTAHPQYLGSVMTTFGAVLLLATDAHIQHGWFGLALVQAAMYVYMSYVEHHC